MSMFSYVSGTELVDPLLICTVCSTFTCRLDCKCVVENGPHENPNESRVSGVWVWVLMLNSAQSHCVILKRAGPLSCLCMCLGICHLGYHAQAGLCARAYADVCRAGSSVIVLSLTSAALSSMLSCLHNFGEGGRWHCSVGEVVWSLQCWCVFDL